MSKKENTLAKRTTLTNLESDSKIKDKNNSAKDVHTIEYETLVRFSRIIQTLEKNELNEVETLAAISDIKLYLQNFTSYEKSYLLKLLAEQKLIKKLNQTILDACF